MKTLYSILILTLVFSLSSCNKGKGDGIKIEITTPPDTVEETEKYDPWTDCDRNDLSSCPVAVLKIGSKIFSDGDFLVKMEGQTTLDNTYVHYEKISNEDTHVSPITVDSFTLLDYCDATTPFQTDDIDVSIKTNAIQFSLGGYDDTINICIELTATDYKGDEISTKAWIKGYNLKEPLVATQIKDSAAAISTMKKSTSVEKIYDLYLDLAFLEGTLSYSEKITESLDLSNYKSNVRGDYVTALTEAYNAVNIDSLYYEIGEDAYMDLVDNLFTKIHSLYNSDVGVINDKVNELGLSFLPELPLSAYESNKELYSLAHPDFDNYFFGQVNYGSFVNSNFYFKSQYDFLDDLL